MDLTAQGAKQIAQYVAGLHAIADIAIGKPGILIIEDAQAEELTKAVLDVMNQYKMKPNPKTVAWMNLIGCATVIYTPKALMLKSLMSAKKRERVENEKSEKLAPAVNNQPPMRFT